MTCGLAVSLPVLLFAGGCASGGGNGTARNPLPSVTSTQKQGRPVLSATKSASVGAIVIDAKGHTLYRFDKDTAKPARSNCAGTCEKKWPPVLAGDQLSTKGVDQGLVAKVKRQDGRWQLTLAGWPLYRYAGDRHRGDVKGQNADGTWFAITPDGKKAAATAAPGPDDRGGAGSGTTRTAFGPLSAADRALLLRMEEAALLELAAAKQAAQRATDTRVKAAGAALAQQQPKLEAEVQSTAARLHVGLPDQPDADQETFLAKLTAASGKEYDKLFVNRLRAAWGKAVTDLAQVRATTRNSLVRAFAQRAVDIVMNQMTALEHTGLVDGSALAQSPASPQQSTASLSYAEPSYSR
jgi:predicted lipoprotein with Yx(FWY)xxD motif/predicted outer membrane protein